MPLTWDGDELPPPNLVKRPKMLERKKAKAKEDRAYWTTRRAVLSRDGHACRACGHTHGLEAHHVIFRSLGGRDELDWLVTLCRDCHRALHGRVLKFHVTYPDRPEYKLVLEWIR